MMSILLLLLPGLLTQNRKPHSTVNRINQDKGFKGFKGFCFTKCVQTLASIKIIWILAALLQTLLAFWKLLKGLVRANIKIESDSHHHPSSHMVQITIIAM
jgi:hypothetical protein